MAGVNGGKARVLAQVLETKDHPRIGRRHSVSRKQSLKTPQLTALMRIMGPILRKYTSFDEMKADEYRYWQSRPVHERMDAVAEMILAA